MDLVVLKGLWDFQECQEILVGLDQKEGKDHLDREVYLDLLEMLEKME
jgi:hypothetical protein